MGPGTRRSRSALLAAASALVVVAVGGCGGGDGGGDAAVAPSTDAPRYVALGDSYTSGAGMGQVVVSAGQCAQSRLAYPSLVAETLGGPVVDMSCGGASTANGTTPQPLAGGGTWPAQFSTLSDQTELVTIGIGFNDGALFGDALFGCTSVAAQDPEGSPCQDDARAAALQALPATIGTRVAAYLAEVRTRAPGAQVVLVGYPQLVPASGTCPALALAAGDYPFVRGLIAAVNEAEQQAAESAGVTYVDVAAASEGHDICSGDQAWINGVRAQQDVAAAYHPFAAEQEAVARLVLSALA